MGTGINVTGKLEAGKLQVGSKIVVMPAGKQGLVKGECTVCLVLSPSHQAFIVYVMQCYTLQYREVCSILC